MAQAETVIYEPPAPSLPYLVVTISPNGVNAVAVKSRTEARVMVSLHKRQGRDDSGPSFRADRELMKQGAAEGVDPG